MKRSMTLQGGGDDAAACAALAPRLADHVRGWLDAEQATDVARHLAACAACRATVAALGLVRDAAGGESPDLWPRLAARLREEEHPVHLRFPAFSWPVAAAATVLLAVPWLAPESGRLAIAVLFGVT